MLTIMIFVYCQLMYLVRCLIVYSCESVTSQKHYLMQWKKVERTPKLIRASETLHFNPGTTLHDSENVSAAGNEASLFTLKK